MTHFLATDEKPDGYKLEDILEARSTLAEAFTVLANNIQILQKITDSIELAEDSTRVLERAFGHSGDAPRIGTAKTA